MHLPLVNDFSNIICFIQINIRGRAKHGKENKDPDSFMLFRYVCLSS